FLDETPDLFKLPSRRDRASKLLAYIADVIVNGHPEVKVKGRPQGIPTTSPVHPHTTPQPTSLPKGTRDAFKDLGAMKFAAWAREQKRLLVTDTTMRDAHQSLLATRMRTADMLAVAQRYATE